MNSARSPSLYRLLTTGDVEAMQREALNVLDTVGFQVENEQMISRLTASSGVRLKNGRVCLAPSLVERHLAVYRAERADQAEEEPPERVHLSVGCCANHIVDLETDAIRPITTADLIDAAKLVDTLHEDAISGHVPGFPQDVPPHLQALAEYKIGCEFMRAGGAFVAPCSIEGLEYLYQMHRVMEQPFGLPLYVVSPLKIAGDSLQAILHFLDRAASLSVTSMPIMGATAPIHFSGAFVQAIAEAIGGFVVLKLIAPDKPVDFDVMAFCLDMKHANITFGSPEQNLCDLIGIAVNAYYGKRQISTRSIRTMAKRPGIQAAAEKGASAVLGALAGSRNFAGAGMLSVDEVFSPEQLMIDREIADYAQRVAQGFEFDTEKLSQEIIRECAISGEFLSHNSTLDNYQIVYWMPRLFGHSMLKDWQQRGAPDLRAGARQMLRQKLAGYDFELPREKKRELHRIYQYACRTLV
jgi:trimethylamine--corrinoid protein Co-methyltransferase